MNWIKDEGVGNAQYKYNVLLDCIYLFVCLYFSRSDYLELNEKKIRLLSVLFTMLSLYSFCDRWTNECGALLEGYWQAKSEVLGEKTVSATVCILSHLVWYRTGVYVVKAKSLWIMNWKGWGGGNRSDPV
jgi:hypothetical protein